MKISGRLAMCFLSVLISVQVFAQSSIDSDVNDLLIQIHSSISSDKTLIFSIEKIEPNVDDGEDVKYSAAAKLLIEKNLEGCYDLRVVDEIANQVVLIRNGSIRVFDLNTAQWVTQNIDQTTAFIEKFYHKFGLDIMCLNENIKSDLMNEEKYSIVIAPDVIVDERIGCNTIVFYERNTFGETDIKQMKAWYLRLDNNLPEIYQRNIVHSSGSTFESFRFLHHTYLPDDEKQKVLAEWTNKYPQLNIN